MTGSLSLADVSKRFRMLEVRCGHCTRSGRLRIDKLTDEYGRDMSLPDLRTLLASDCEHKLAARRKDQCQVFYPQLRELKCEGTPYMVPRILMASMKSRPLAPHIPSPAGD